jgi:hypothetical protein
MILPVIFLWRAVAQSGMTALPSCVALSQMSQRQFSLSCQYRNEGARNYDEGS